MIDADKQGVEEGIPEHQEEEEEGIFVFGLAPMLLARPGRNLVGRK